VHLGLPGAGHAAAVVHGRRGSGLPWWVGRADGPEQLAGEPSELFGVSAVSVGDVWAVGVTLPQEVQPGHWWSAGTGGEWRTVPSPGRRPGDSFLNAVAALSASDAWAVGLSRSPDGPARTLVLHWDGRQWAITDSPNAGPGDNSLVSVAAISARDAWAVGYRDAGSVYRSLGGALGWRSLDSRAAAAARRPGRRAERGRRDPSGVVWAVGGSARARGPSQPLVLRLDGRSWSPVPAPASLHSATLNGVAALGRRRAWVVGATRSGGGDRAFGLRADARTWRIVPIDLAAALSIDLNAIWAPAPDDMWAVGSSFDGRWYRPLVEHRAGGRWSGVPVPDIPGHDGRLMAVDGLARGELWAVGSASPAGGRPAWPDPPPLRQLALLTAGGRHWVATGSSSSRTSASSASTRIASAGR
jgi:hypothetical protein